MFLSSPAELMQHGITSSATLPAELVLTSLVWCAKLLINPSFESGK